MAVLSLREATDRLRETWYRATGRTQLAEELRAEDFLPWIDADAARGKGLSEAEYAARQAETWKKGLAEWSQDGERIRRLKEAAEFAIYTPASTAGLPVSILGSFAAPPPARTSWTGRTFLTRR